MVRIERELRGLPIWLLKEYLLELGGVPEGEGLVTGAGWQAKLTQMDDFRIGSLAVGQVRLELQGEDAAMTELMSVLEKKLLRAGG